MIRFFLDNDIVSVTALLVYTALIKAYVLFSPNLYQPNVLDSFIGHYIFSFGSNALIWQYALTVLFIFTQALQINALANDNRMYYSRSSLAGLFYVLLTSIVPEYMLLSPALVGMSFVLFAIQNVYEVYKKVNALNYIFNAALLISLASVFYPPYIILLIAVFVELHILRSFSFKEQLQYIVGYLSLIWIVGVILYYFDVLSFDFFDSIRLGGSIELFIISDFIDLVALLVICCLLLFVLLNYYSYQKKKEVHARKKIDFLYWLFLFSLIDLLIFKDILPNYIVFLIFPLSILLAISMGSVKKIRRIELFHLLLLALVLFVQYNHLFAVEI